MNNTVQVRNIKIGEGIPKICVSLVGTAKEDILKELNALENAPVDLVEWRADYFEDIEDIDKIKDSLNAIRNAIEDIPLIFTFRTKTEGGQKHIELECYVNLLIEIIETGQIDLVDIELFFLKEEKLKGLVDFSNDYNVKTIISNHDFNKTPPRDEITSRLIKMQELGAHIPKIALMPNSPLDVLELLQASYTMKEKHPKTPIITMSMKDMGVISRIAGSTFGSAVTFASLTKASAPGQIEVRDLRTILDILY